MTNLRAEPKHWPRSLAECRKCGARARNRGGAPCRAPAVRGKRRCRLHGGGRGSGGQLGPKNGAFRHGKFTQEAAEVSKFFREMARDGEELLAVTLDRFGKKPPRVYRRRRHVMRALAAAAKAKGEAKK
jgi:hypothetical protein